MIFILDIIIQFHTSIIIKNGLRTRVKIRSGQTIARFYILRGSFPIDFISALSLMLVLALPEGGSSNSTTSSLVITVFRFMRIVRVIRLVRALFSVHMTPASNKIMLFTTYSLTLVYSMFLMLNFMACLWIFVGSNDGPRTGWMAQEYSTHPPKKLSQIASRLRRQ